MGASQSLQFETNQNNFRAWSLDHVRNCFAYWKETIGMEFGISKAQLAEILGAAADGIDCSALVEDVYAKLTHGRNADTIDALGVLSTAALLCQAEFNDKAELIFSSFDFDEDGAISKDELTILVIAALLGIVRYCFPDQPLPADDICESFAESAFLDIDKDLSDNISAEEFAGFVHTQLDTDRDGFLSPEELAAYFGVVVTETTGDSDLEYEQSQPPSSSHSKFALADDHTANFVPVKAYRGDIKPPSEPVRAINAAPDADLDLDWVYGYRCHDTRNNVHFLASGRVAYHTAAVGVVYDQANHTQQQYLGHTDDIVSLAVHPNGRIVATGQMGKEPTIHVWDAEAPEGEQLLAVLRSGALKRAVLHVAFSPDGTQLAAVGQDDDHTLCVFKDWQQGSSSPTLTAETTGDKLLGLAFTDQQLITVGVKHVKFWEVRNGRINGTRGLFGRKGKIQPVLCAAYFNGFAVTGAMDGSLYKWNGRDIEKVVKAHTKTVNAMHVSADGSTLYTAGRDGHVCMFDGDLNPIGRVNMNKAPGMVTSSARLRAVSVTADGATMAVSTKAGEIFTLDIASGAESATMIVQSHYYGETWGLAAHPTANRFVSTGDDRTVRLWDADEHKCLNVAKMDTYIRAVAYSPDGATIALGSGGRLGGVIPKINGAFYVLDAETLEVVHSGQDSQRWIQELKYSPDGTMLAVASHDQAIYVYDATAGYELKYKLTGHSSYLTHVDFTADSKFLQSNSGDYEILYWNMETGEQDPWGATNTRDAEWATWTCVLGFPVGGIFPPESDGTDVNAADRSKDGRLLATSDDFGHVNLFNYPAPNKGWMHSQYIGHSSHVTCVRWNHDDSMIFSVGGNDKSCFQWRLDRDDEDEAPAEGEAEVDEIEVVLDAPVKTHIPGPSVAEIAKKRLEAHRAQDPFADDDQEVEQFAVAHPFVQTMEAPSTPPQVDKEEPMDEITLEWAFGCQTQASRGSVAAVEGGRIAYHVGAVGVLFNPTERTQKFFRGQHKDDIVCLARTDDGTMIATGEHGKNPTIQVWDVAKRRVKWSFSGHQRGVQCLAFSPDGRQLASVGMDDSHTVLVHDVANGQLICSQKGDTNKILSMAWSPDGSYFVTVGVRHIYFWYPRARGMRQRRGLLGSGTKRQVSLGIAFDAAGNAVVGQYDGSMLVFDADRKVANEIGGAHDGAIYMLKTVDGSVYSGARDGVVKKWAGDLSGSEDVCTLEGSIRSIDVAQDGSLVVATSHSEIFTVTDGEPTRVVTGHYHGEVWGLATHPERHQFVTSGDDRTVRVWDAIERTELARTELDTLVRAATYSPDGTLIAVGMGGRLGGKEEGPEGAFAVLNAENLELVHHGHDAAEWIEDIKFSPDGNLLAVGSHDNFVYVYDATADFELKFKLEGHSSYITHFDFTADSKFLQSNCGAYETLYFDVESGERDPWGSSKLKDADWATWTCVLGYPVKGIWPAGADGTDVNAVDRSHDGTRLASSDDFGKVNLYKWPAVDYKAGYLTLTGHSSHVTNVRWSFDDAKLMSAGGNDRGIFVWYMSKATVAEDDTALDDDEDLAREMKCVKDRSPAFEAANFGAFYAPEAKANQDPVGAAGDEDAEAAAEAEPAPAPKVAWREKVEAPSAPKQKANEQANTGLKLNWAYGYRCDDTRSNLRYIYDGTMVYHTAAVGVVYDQANHTQRHYLGHTDDIVCLAVHPNGRIVATGQMGRTPTIHIWDAATMKRVNIISGFHSRAVSLLEFSPDGSKLISVGDDNDHSVAVYDWKAYKSTGKDAGRNVVTARGHQKKLLDCAAGANGSFCVVGVRCIKIFDTKSCNSKRAFMGDSGKLQAFIAVRWFNSGYVVGTASGDLYVLKGRKVAQVIKAHDGPIATMWIDAEGWLLTGSNDGLVKAWNADYENVDTIDCNTLGVLRSGIRSVAGDPVGNVCLGLRSGEIVERKQGEDPTILVSGHFYGETWGVATHPTANQFVTAGDDKTVRIWDAETHKQLAITQLDTLVRAACYSPDGSHVAVGLGGRLGGKEEGPEGAFAVLNAETLEVVHQGHDAAEWIEDLKFSPDGSLLAVGSHDNAIYVYDAAAGFELKFKLEAHSSYITHLDFTADSKFLQTNSGAYEILYWDMESGERDPAGSTNLKDADWATWTCVLGYPVKGIWPAGADGTDVNAVSRSGREGVMVTGDDFGFIKLFSFPAPEPGWANIRYGGHSSHVADVCWSHDDGMVFSAGGNDKTILQWAVHGPTGDESLPTPVEAIVAIEVDEEVTNPEPAPKDLFEIKQSTRGDEFGAMKARQAKVEPPTDKSKQFVDPYVTGTLGLEWVYGYQAQAVRNSVRYVQNPAPASNFKGDIAYSSAAVGVIYDTNSHRQRHHYNLPARRGCTDDITAVATSRDGQWIAVGERGRSPVICVFNALTMATVAVLSGHRNGVGALAFSQCGTYLASAGDDNHHTVMVHDWNRAALLSTQKGDTNRILDIAWSANDKCILTAGVRHAYVWERQSGSSTFRRRRIITTGVAKLEPFISVGILGDKAVFGGASGSIMIADVGKRTAVASFSGCHSAAITSMYSDVVGNRLFTGSDDGEVKSWRLAGVKSLSREESWKFEAGVRSICCEPKLPLLVGTKDSSIIQVDKHGEQSIVVQGHRAAWSDIGEVWGLATHPERHQFVTAGDDRTVRTWNMFTHKQVASAQLDTLVRAATYSPDGTLIAVGLGGRLGGKEEGPEGAFAVLNAETLEVVHQGHDAAEWIEDIKFSPDGSKLAVGSHDNFVYVYDATAEFALLHKLSGHSSYITHFDFTADGKFLQSNCGAYETLYFDVESGDRDPSGASNLRDAEWATWTCVLGWPVKGIWPAGADGTDINAVDRSHNGKLLASGDDFGKVNLFNWPATRGTTQEIFHGHSSHVTNVRWSFDDAKLMSAGGNDRGVFQWTVMR